MFSLNQFIAFFRNTASVLKDLNFPNGLLVQVCQILIYALAVLLVGALSQIVLSTHHEQTAKSVMKLGFSRAAKIRFSWQELAKRKAQAQGAYFWVIVLVGF